MPIKDCYIEDRIFFAHESGLLTPSDAMVWVSYLEQQPITPDAPVVAIVDAREVTQVTGDAMFVFLQASYCSKLLAVLVVSSVYNMAMAHAFADLGEEGKTHIFTSYEKALAFAHDLLG